MGTGSEPAITDSEKVATICHRQQAGPFHQNTYGPNRPAPMRSAAPDRRDTQVAGKHDSRR